MRGEGGVRDDFLLKRPLSEGRVSQRELFVRLGVKEVDRSGNLDINLGRKGGLMLLEQ